MSKNPITNNSKKCTFKIVVFLVLIIIVCYAVFIEAFNQKTTSVQQAIETQTIEQERTVRAIAELTGRNGGDEVTLRVVKDCSISDREILDNLLSSLNAGLSQNEIVELDRLFGRCGSYFSEVKSVMVARLQREVEVYETFVALLNEVSNQDLSSEYKVETWNRLAELEVKQSVLFADLVKAQDKIITLLLEGNLPTSEIVMQAAQTANQIQETLFVTSAQTTEIRNALIST